MQEGADPYEGMNHADLQKTVIDLQRRRTALESKYMYILSLCIWGILLADILIHFDMYQEYRLAVGAEVLGKSTRFKVFIQFWDTFSLCEANLTAQRQFQVMFNV